jgi:hypothetical protein
MPDGKKFRKSALIVLLAVLAALGSAGCGAQSAQSTTQAAQNGQSEQNTQNAQNTQVAQSEQSEQSPQAEQAAQGGQSPQTEQSAQSGGAAVFESVFEATMWDTNLRTVNRPEQDVVTPTVTERTGVLLGDVYLNEGRSAVERMNLFVGGGDLPDMIKVLKYEPEIFTVLMEEGMLRPVTRSDIETYAPDIAKRLAEAWYENFEVGGDGGDGYYYGLPINIKNSIDNWDMANTKNYKEYMETMPVGTTEAVGFSVRDDILRMVYPDAPSWQELQDAYMANGKITRDELMAGVFQTFDEMEEFLYKVKELGLTEDGKPVIPYCDTDMGNVTNGTMFSQSGVESPGQFGFNWHTKEYEFPAEHEPVKNMLKRLNGWLRDGIIPMEMGVSKSDANQTIIDSGVVVVTINNLENLNIKMESLGKPFRYRRVYLDKVSGEEPGYSKDRCDVPADILQYTLFNSKLSEEQYHRLLSYVNFFYSDEGLDLVAWGPASAGLYEEVGDRRRFVTAELENSALLNANVAGEKNLGYYGLGYRNNVFGTISYDLGAVQPNDPVINYANQEASEKFFASRALAAVRDGSVQRYYKGWDWVINDTDETVIEIRKITSPLGAEMRNRYISRVIFADDDAQFEELYNELVELPRKACEAEGKDIDELRRSFAEAYVSWYDERGLEYPAQTFENKHKGQ